MKSLLQLLQQSRKPCTFCKTPFNLVLKVQRLCVCRIAIRKAIPVDSNVIRRKVKSLCDNLKQKEGEGSKAGEFNTNKGWFITLERGVA